MPFSSIWCFFHYFRGFQLRSKINKEVVQMLMQYSAKIILVVTCRESKIIKTRVMKRILYKVLVNKKLKSSMKTWVLIPQRRMILKIVSSKLLNTMMISLLSYTILKKKRNIAQNYHSIMMMIAKSWLTTIKEMDLWFRKFKWFIVSQTAMKRVCRKTRCHHLIWALLIALCLKRVTLWSLHTFSTKRKSRITINRKVKKTIRK